MSFSRQGDLLIEYSASPLLKILRVMTTSSNSMGSVWSELSRVRETSAKPMAETPWAPLKMTSSISSPRTDLYDCVPRTHLMASTTFDFPQPLGPTTPVTPRSNVNSVRLAKDLKPHISSFLSCIFPSLYPGTGERGTAGGNPSLLALRILYRREKANSAVNVR